MKHNVGLLIFSETRAREDVYRQRKPLQDRETRGFVQALREDLDFLVPACGEIRGRRDVRCAAAEINSSAASAVILYIPIFVSPALVVQAARLVNRPLVLMGNRSADTLSQLGQLASGGAIDQIGIPCRRIPGDVRQPSVREELLAYLRAAAVSDRLMGTTFGCIGGRSLGISTGVADPVLWQRIFGVDIEHVDQYELVLRAESIPREKVERHVRWVHDNYGRVCYEEGRFDERGLDRMVRSYLAAKGIVEDHELDFIGIKCQPEMSNGYVPQCMAVQMLNDPYDAEGPKEPMVCACEADSDGSLTMQILKLISGGQPTALQDIAHLDDRSMVLANCGAMASHFARLSDNPRDNLSEVYLQPHGFGEAGGAATQFVCAEDTFTYARLFRRDGVYHMAVLKGRTEKRPREELGKYSWYRPTSFVNVDIDGDAFMREYGSNHIHCVRGDFTAELAEFCGHKGIVRRMY